MADAKARWAQIRERRLNTPELREQYENTKREVTLTRQILMEIDERRKGVGLSKAALARSIEANPTTIRRMFTAPSANPSMRMVFRMLDALGMDIEVKQVTAPKAALFVRGARITDVPTRKTAALRATKEGRMTQPKQARPSKVKAS